MKLCCTEEPPRSAPVRGPREQPDCRTAPLQTRTEFCIKFWFCLGGGCSLRQLQVVKEPARAPRYLCRYLWNCLAENTDPIRPKRCLTRSTVTRIARPILGHRKQNLTAFPGQVSRFLLQARHEA